MRLRAERGPIPLPDAEVIARCVVRRALPPDPINWPPSLQSRVTRLAGAMAVDLDALVLSWPDDHYCVAIAPWARSDDLPVLGRPVILAAYRHALRDPQARELFYTPGNLCGGGR